MDVDSTSIGGANEVNDLIQLFSKSVNTDNVPKVPSTSFACARGVVAALPSGASFTCAPSGVVKLAPSALTCAPSAHGTDVKLKRKKIDKLISGTRIMRGENFPGYPLIDFLKEGKITPNTKGSYDESAASLAAYDDNERFFIRIICLNGPRRLSMKATYGKTKYNVLEIAVKANSVKVIETLFKYYSKIISDIHIHNAIFLATNMNNATIVQILDEVWTKRKNKV